MSLQPRPMEPWNRKRTTRMLLDSRNGVRGATSDLMPLVYEALHDLAVSYMRRERRSHTLQPTALVHEAFLRLIDSDVEAIDRVHFLAIAAGVMRRVLAEHARGRGRVKRGGAARRLTLSNHLAQMPRDEIEILALDEALGKLGRLSERQARVVELRYFGGLTVAEVAETLDLSKRSVELDWTMARSFLRRELVGEGPER